MRINRLHKTLIIVFVLAVLGYFMPVDYYVIRPSRAVDLSGLIAVESADVNGDENDNGAFYLLTVVQNRANFYSAVYGYFHPHMNLNPRERVIPRDMDEDQYRELLREHMNESQHIAQVVAMRRAGYEVDIVSDGVEVIDFLEDAPAEGYLQTGDIISHVEGKNVVLASEVPLLIQDKPVGKEITLEIVRNSNEIALSVPTGPHPDDEEIPFLGIYIQTLSWEPVVPVKITMDTGNISGPSAGLMFVLEIMNQITADDLTGGKLIAGTGTVDLDERVGRIGGVIQKVIAAEKDNIDYFLLPSENYEEARKAARDIKLVPVSELQEALDFLSKLECDD